MSSNLLLVAVAVTAVAVVAGYFFLQPSGPVLSKEEFREFPLVDKTVLSHNSALYRFGLPRPSDILGLPIGQHISIAATINEKQVVRSYTPTSSDDDKGYFDLVIKSYPTGNISKYIAQLQLGDTIKVRGPKGQFNYHNGLVKAFGMVAGGTGITPMLQIIRAIAKNPEDNTKVSLIYGNISESDILLKKELDEIVAANDNIKVFYMLDSPPENWIGGQGYVTPEIMKEHLPAPTADVKLLLCGPPPMISTVKKHAVTLGFEKANPVSKLQDQIFAF